MSARYNHSMTSVNSATPFVDDRPDPPTRHVKATDPSTSQWHRINVTWLLKLRWVAVVGQLLTIAGSVLLFDIQIPMMWAVVLVITITGLSNLMLAWWFRIRSHSSDEKPWLLILGLVLMMDMLSLTVLLYVSGGPNNPFSLFFFVNLCLCALVLNRKWAWCINGLANVCFAALMVSHHSLPALQSWLPPIRETGIVTLSHVGLLTAFFTCSSVIVHFMNRLTAEVAQQNEQIQLAQTAKALGEKMEALGTLAAGTAHELATPLGTIAVVAREVEAAFERHPPDFPGADEVVQDVHLIRSQLDRCRAILDRMSSHAGETIGEQIQSVTLEQLARRCMEGVIGSERISLSLPPEADRKVEVPVDGLSQAIRGLIQNAIDANLSNEQVQIDVTNQPHGWQFEIRDRGTGMSEEVLARVSEPFFTTKSPGKGMGFGRVFSAKRDPTSGWHG